MTYVGMYQNCWEKPESGPKILLKLRRLPYRISQKLQNAATFAQSAKIVARILRRRIERIIEDLLGEDQFGFRIGKVSGDATEMLRIITG